MKTETEKKRIKPYFKFELKKLYNTSIESDRMNDKLESGPCSRVTYFVLSACVNLQGRVMVILGLEKREGTLEHKTRVPLSP